MKVYMHDNKPGDSRLPHDSGIELQIRQLEALGILYYDLPPCAPSSAMELDDIAAARGYVSRDELILSPDTLGGPAAYENVLKKFFEEHFHHDEEIRYVLEGTGYFDVRDREDKWIRFRVDPGDLVVLPAGIYHRFTLGDQNFGRAIRLFKHEPKWEAIKRREETDKDESRKAYLLAVSQGIKV